MQYSNSVANVVTDATLIPVNDTWHPKFDGIVYWAMDWDCPTFDTVMAAQLTKYYGNITAENTIYGITPIVQTGNLHVAIYDLTDQASSFCRTFRVLN